MSPEFYIGFAIGMGAFVYVARGFTGYENTFGDHVKTLAGCAAWPLTVAVIVFGFIGAFLGDAWTALRRKKGR
jgi:hypothetical protein